MKAKVIASIIGFGILTKSAIFTYGFADGILSILQYRKQKFFPDQLIRIARSFMFIGTAAGFLSTKIAGFYLITDSLFSLSRYRNQEIYHHFPRYFRFGLGWILMTLPIW